MTEPVHVRSAVEREGGIPWVDAYLNSESALYRPIELPLLLPAESLRPNRAERRQRRKGRR